MDTENEIGDAGPKYTVEIRFFDTGVSVAAYDHRQALITDNVYTWECIQDLLDVDGCIGFTLGEIDQDRTTIRSSGQFDEIGVEGVVGDSLAVDYGEDGPRVVVHTENDAEPTHTLPLPERNHD